MNFPDFSLSFLFSSLLDRNLGKYKVSVSNFSVLTLIHTTAAQHMMLASDYGIQIE